VHPALSAVGKKGRWPHATVLVRFRVFISAGAAGAFDQIVHAVLHPCLPFFRLFTAVEKGTPIIHIKSQFKYLTS